ncbi:MAG: ABC transporter permease subunit, partial [Candidatus Woesearchaeota archaeon]
YFENEGYYNTATNPITNLVEQIDSFKLRSETVNDLDNKLTTTNNRLDEISTQIQDYNDDNELEESSENKNEILILMSEYDRTVHQLEEIVDSKIYLDGLDDYSQKQIHNLKGFGSRDYDKYYLKEKLTKNNYLFKNEDFSFNYALPFSASTTSTSQINAFDFSFYALQLIMAIIIIYMIVLAAKAVAGEQNTGTLKLLAMRPYKRYKIILGKLLSLIFVTGFLIFFGFLISLLTGWYIFGIDFTSVISVINSNIVLVSSPIAFMLLYLLTAFIQAIFFIIIVMSISIILKTYLGAIVSGFLFYFSSLFVVLVPESYWLKYIPIFNTNLYKYFGTYFSNNNTLGGLESVFSGAIFPGDNLVLALQLIFGTITILLIASISIFKNRDID